MKHLPVILFIISILSGCAPKLRFDTDWEAYETTRRDTQSVTLPADFAASWSAINSVVDELGFRKIVADSNTGLLMCSKSQEPWENTTLEINILLRSQSASATDVHFNSQILAVPTAAGMELQVYPSSGDTDKIFFDRLISKLGTPVLTENPIHSPVVSRPSVTTTPLQPERTEFLAARQIRELFSNKTVHGYHNKKGYEFVRVYMDGGKLTGSSSKKGERDGSWEVNSIGLCEQWAGKQKKCRGLKKEGGHITKYNSKGRLLVTYKDFQKL